MNGTKFSCSRLDFLLDSSKTCWGVTDWLKYIMGLTSGISWTLVVDSFSSGGSFPWHREKVLVFTYLVRRCKKQEIYSIEMKQQSSGHRKITIHTLRQTWQAKEKGKKDKNKIQINPNLIPLYIAQCSLSVSQPQYSISFHLHHAPSLYSSVFPLLPSLS